MKSQGSCLTFSKPAVWAFSLLIALLLPAPVWPQSDNASIDGVVLDPSGAVVPDAELTLTAVATAVERKAFSGSDGLYSFQNLRPGDYELLVAAFGFRVLVRSGISLRPNQKVRLDLELEVGEVTETVTVSAAVAAVNFENATQETGVGPNILNQLPLIVAGNIRNITNFALLVPGVNPGGTGNNPFEARVNGGMVMGDDAVLDGASMSSIGGNIGFVNFFDMNVTPDMVSEFKMVTSNYEPHWGATTSSQIVATTHGGTNEYHGGAFWYHRNTVLNARPWGRPERSPNLENDFGGFIGGLIPGLNRGKMKAFGYFLHEGYRKRGGVNVETLSIPSLKQRIGDFSDWADSDGNLIPVYDPLTTRTAPDGTIIRDQFMGCDGQSPNVICPVRIADSLAHQWLQHVPQPTNGQPINNYVVPSPDVFNLNYNLTRIDFHPSDADHIAGTHWNSNFPTQQSGQLLPPILDPKFINKQDKDMVRLNWDHTFSPTLLNSFNFGWTHARFTEGPGNAEFADKLPKIPGVGSHVVPPAIHFGDGFQQFGSSSNVLRVSVPNGVFVWNNLTTWVRGRHTFKFGREYWHIRKVGQSNGPGSGRFQFNRLTTGLLGVNSGNPIASFLLERVSNATSFFTSIDRTVILRDAYMSHLGDTWKVTPKLTLNLGLRWDLFRPGWEGSNQNSFFDALKPNPGADGRLGALVFAGDEWGEASFGKRYPEHLFKTGFAPRVGVAYALNDKTVLRAGYGIFYSQVLYPGWTDGISTEGFEIVPSFSATQGGLEPAMILREGFPQGFQKPPFIDPSFNNGQDIFYRDFNGNKLPYSQQWSLTLERQLGSDSSLSLAYVANQGSRLMSDVAAVNVLDPQYLALGPKLYDQFQPGQTSLHGVPLPYNGWVEQMGCAPSVAQALLPYPQYCSRLTAVNENAGRSSYHSLQLRLQRNFSAGAYLLASYTLSKMLTSAGSVQTPVTASRFGSTLFSAFSPFERQRAKSLANDDVPHNLTLAWVYELPFGRGRRFHSRSKAVNTLIGGWSVSGIYRAVSGVPLWVRSSQCEVPAQFRASCVPALLDGADPFLQTKQDFDPAQGPLLNKDAFEPLSSFERFGYWGAGPRVLPHTRLFGLQNWDVSIYKNTALTEHVNLQLRFELFNAFNLHYFAGSAVFGFGPFISNLASPFFGSSTGQVTDPRNIQIGARLEF